MKTCPRCGEAKPLDQFHRDASRQDGLWLWCKACGRETQRRYRQKNPERARERSRRWHEENRDRAAAYGRRWVQENPDRARELPRLRRERLRTAVFDHYGQACACCGTAENLSIDHVNGDGTEHRMELFGSSNVSTGMYLWLIRNGFPAGFQTLCRSCNASKKRGERCHLDHAAAPAPPPATPAPPLYARVASHIAARIEAGELEPARKLPPERELAAEYECAYNTMRSAMQILRDRGLIVTMQGRGTYVAEREAGR